MPQTVQHTVPSTPPAEADAPADASVRAPFSVRLVKAVPGGPLAGGVLLAAGHYAVFLLLHALGSPLGALPLDDAFFLEEVLGPNAIMSFLVGFAPAAMALSKHGALACAAALTPALAQGFGARRRVAARVCAWPRAPMRAVGLLAVVAVVPAVFLDPAMRQAMGRYGPVDLLWLAGANALTAWLVARALVHEAWLARTFSRLGRHDVRVDLFDTRPLRAFARRGVQSVLLWSLAASVFSLLFVGGWAAEMAPQVLVAIVASAAVTLALPVLGVHASLREAKEAELSRLGAALREARDALLEAGEEADPRPAEAARRIPALTALEARTAAVREWPFDASTGVRFLVYVSIGLASWIGAALVERVLDAAIR